MKTLPTVSLIHIHSAKRTVWHKIPTNCNCAWCLTKFHSVGTAGATVGCLKEGFSDLKLLLSVINIKAIFLFHFLKMEELILKWDGIYIKCFLHVSKSRHWILLLTSSGPLHDLGFGGGVESLDRRVTVMYLGNHGQSPDGSRWLCTSQSERGWRSVMSFIFVGHLTARAHAVTRHIVCVCE